MKKLPVHDDGHDGPPDLDRRELMQLLAAGAGLAGFGALAGCMEGPTERIRPRVEQPPEMVPGVPIEYATSIVIDGFATGVVVKTHEARPTKVEGNPDHPASLGATNAYHQASVLELYDPYRLGSATERGIPIDLVRALRTIAHREPIRGLWFVMPPHSSPLVAAQLERVKARHPGVRFATYAPLERRDVYRGAQLALGRPVETQYRFADADVVVSLDADFLAGMANSVRWSRDFAKRRRIDGPTSAMSRLYVAEPCPSPTGSLADHRLAVRPSSIPAIARALLEAVRGHAHTAGELRERRWVNAAAADLVAHRGRSIVVVGEREAPEVHQIGHILANELGSVGATITYTEPALVEPLGDGMTELLAAMRSGDVHTLVILDGNPVYDAPREFTALLANVPETICVAPAPNETSARCRWYYPLAHVFESWGDARAYDGTLSFIQPMIRPLKACVTAAELLAAFGGDEQPDGHRLLRDLHADVTWDDALRRGFVENSAAQPVTATLRTNADDAPAQHTGFEIALDRSHATYDGRFANNAWLQELPSPNEKMTWGNAAIVSPATAATYGIDTGSVVRISHAGATVELPVYVLPGHADGCATVALGYGRVAGGPVANDVGVNIYPLRPLGAGFLANVTIESTGDTETVACTQQHFTQDGRDIAPSATLTQFRAKPAFTEEQWGPKPTFFGNFLEGTPQWAMTIDTMICTGCSACVVACQAENNIPVVGKKGVIRNREMHWLRIDTYRSDDGDGAVVHQPMMCQHCEKAPCEYVCPVYATQHSPDGLNEMTYNRCIGTRFCSNNCPYKVRRFNWFDLTEDTPKTTRLQFNPSVTVRARGVMEKCTYCVQRIRAAEIASRKEKREIKPGEVVTACQQACPTGAIQFGSLHHTDTTMVRWRDQSRHYAVLHHLGTVPRTAYLAKITNPGDGA